MNFLTLNIAVQFIHKLHQDISKVTGILQTLSVLFKMGIYKSMHVKLWTRHWIPFLDSMLQIELNRFYTTSVYLHTDITKMPLYFLLNLQFCSPSIDQEVRVCNWMNMILYKMGSLVCDITCLALNCLCLNR